MSEAEAGWKKLHPASLWVNLVPRTWRTLWSLWPIVLLAIVGGGGGIGLRPEDAVFLLFFLVSGAASTIVHYFTLRYRVVEDRLEIRQGLLNREARAIDASRIQNAEMLRNPFHKLAGLVEVRLETAGALRTEGLLSALSEEAARDLMTRIDAARGREPVDDDATEKEPVKRLGTLELLAYGLTSHRAGMAGLLLAGAYEVATVLDPMAAERAALRAEPAQLAGLVLMTLALAAGISATLTLIRHHDYRLHDKGEELASEEGLLTRRKVEVPLRKVQLVHVEETLPRRWMGFGKVQVETAGIGQVGEGGVRAPELTVPVVQHHQLFSMSRLAVPQAAFDPWSTKLRPAHRRALWRALFQVTVRHGGFCLLALIASWKLAAAVALVFPILWVGAWLDWRYQGWMLTDTALIARRGFWRRHTWVVPRNKLQAVHLLQGPILRIAGLGRVLVRVAGAQVLLPDLATDDARAVMDELCPA